MNQHLFSKFVLAFVPVTLAGAPTAASLKDLPKERIAKLDQRKAAGTFDVKLTPTGAADAAVGVLSIAKTFHGDIEGTSTGQMLAIGTAVKESAGYVAMERVTASLDGKHGTFALQHSGSMNRGVPSLMVTVVPDSGTGELIGIDGSLEINVEGGKHNYAFYYTMPK